MFFTIEFERCDKNVSFVHTDLEAAYRRACAEGSKEVFLARMNLVGFHEAGKTSLAKRLMGKDFDAKVQSTEGISLHYITSTFRRNKLTGKNWNETDIKVDDLNKEVIQNMKQFVGTSKENQSNKKEARNKEPENSLSTEERPLFIQRLLRLIRRFFSKTNEANYVAVPEETDMKSESDGLSMSSRFKELTLENFDKPSQIASEYKPFTLRLWDLGGQNDFLTTHHLFLDVEATTVIVMDITKEFNRKFEHPDKDLKLKQNNPSSPKDIMHYWLNSFYTEAKEKERKTGKGTAVNILVVLTHIDYYDSGIERQERIKQYKDEIMMSLREKKYAPFVTEDNIFAIDNKTGRDESFYDLKEQLFESFFQQQSWNKEMPMKWLRLQADILEMKEQGEKYMTMMNLKELGGNVGMDNTEIESFLKTHNAVGTFLHFNYEQQLPGGQLFHLAELKNFIITDPQWLVDMCKEVITHPEFLFQRRSKLGPYERLKLHTLEELQKGYVTQESLKTLWGSDEAVSYLTKLMLTFEIFIPLTDSEESIQNYLIPCMLPMSNENYEGSIQEEIVILYNGVHKAECGNWIHMGKLSNLFSTIIQTNNWKLSLKPLPAYDRFSFKCGEELRLQLSLEKGPKPDSNFRAVVYCSRPALKNRPLQETLKQMRELLSHTRKEITIENEKDLERFCPYYGLQEAGLRLVLSMEEIDKLKCPCHKKNLSDDDYSSFLENYVCKSHTSFVSLSLLIDA